MHPHSRLGNQESQGAGEVKTVQSSTNPTAGMIILVHLHFSLFVKSRRLTVKKAFYWKVCNLRKFMLISFKALHWCWILNEIRILKLTTCIAMSYMYKEAFILLVMTQYCSWSVGNIYVKISIWRDLYRTKNTISHIAISLRCFIITCNTQ